MERPFSFSLMTTLFILLLIIFRLLKAWTKSKGRTGAAGQTPPPGPWKLPLIGNMHQLIGSAPHRKLRDLSMVHGPLMLIQLGEIQALIISSPRLAEEILKTHDATLANRPKLLVSEYLLYESDIGFSPYGPYWRQMRKICAQKLLSASKVQGFRALRENEVWNLVESIKSLSGRSQYCNLSEELYSLQSRITCKAAVGKTCKDQKVLMELMKSTTALAGGFDVADVFPSVKFLHVLSGMKQKLVQMHCEIDQVLNDIIDDRRNQHMLAGDHQKNGQSYLEEDDDDDEDLLDVLLQLQKHGRFEFPIKDKNIKAIVFDMFTGSTETSAATVEWAISELMKHPRVMNKAQAELRQSLKGKDKIHESDIQELSYLKLVIKETLRLHPPAPFSLPRECQKPYEIDGYYIPAKTRVLINIWAIGRDPAYWDDAESFVPERFENSNVSFAGSNFEYIPFGGGRRICPGMLFGLATIQLSLALLLYHFNWKLPGGGMKPEDLDMEETRGAIARRRKDLCLIATPFMPN